MKTKLSPLRILVKALCLFGIVNILFGLVNPGSSRISGYNVVFPGRTRLPFGISGDPYTVSVDNVDAMFASHIISTGKQSNEFRVALIGDSSVWGENLGAHEVISEQWNNLQLQCGDKIVTTYDLGYPHPSVVKDLVILDKAVEYDPDLIIWFVTLNSLISQRVNPFLVENQARVSRVLATYDIAFKQGSKFAEEQPGFWERTLIGQRSILARQLKLEMLGIIWTATGADTNPRGKHLPPNFKVDDDPSFRGMEPSGSIKANLLFSALTAGRSIAGPVPVLIVNEPIFIAKGANGIVRYNIPYPRWAYDQYREAMTAQAQTSKWKYLDLWNVIPPEYFSDAGLHLSATGEQLLIQQMNPALQSFGCN